MPDQFTSCIAGCPQSADYICLFSDRVSGSDCKDKCHDHDDDIKKHDHHRTVTAHIIPSENDCLVRVSWDKFFQCHFFCHIFHQIFRNVFFCLFIFGLSIVFPCVAVIQLIGLVAVELLWTHYRHAKFYRVKHGIIIIGKQGAVI